VIAVQEVVPFDVIQQCNVVKEIPIRNHLKSNLSPLPRKTNVIFHCQIPDLPVIQQNETPPLSY
jgi:hypothetical protein